MVFFISYSFHKHDRKKGDRTVIIYIYICVYFKFYCTFSENRPIYCSFHCLHKRSELFFHHLFMVVSRFICCAIVSYMKDAQDYDIYIYKNMYSMNVVIAH